MAYLTSKEFGDFGYSPPSNGGDFVKAEKAAEIIINNVTNFYDEVLGGNSLDDDASSSLTYRNQRAMAFKKAVAMQTQFIIESGIDSAYKLQQNNLSSYSVDGTSMTFKTSIAKSMTVGSTGMLKQVKALLGKYGLIYIGVDHV